MKAKQPAREVLDVNLPELEALLARLRQGSLDEESYQKLQSLLKAFRYLVEQIGDKDATISRLRALLMKPSTEKTSKVLEQAGIKAKNSSPPHAKKKPKPGHGRNGAQAYRGAHRIKIAHARLKAGDRCPECLKGKVYEQKDPGLRIRVVGQAGFWLSRNRVMFSAAPFVSQDDPDRLAYRP
jgi:transposase